MSSSTSYLLLLATLLNISGVLAQSSSNTAGAAAKPTASTRPGNTPIDHYGNTEGQEVDNLLFSWYILWCFAAIVVSLAVYRVWLSSVKYIRKLACLANEHQIYFKLPNAKFASLKQHLLYAPLFAKRHCEQIYIFRGWSIGILPTRFQSLFLTGVIAMNVTLCVMGIEFWQGDSMEVFNHLRNRTGTLAVVNMIPLVIMAGRNNPLIKLLNISFDTFNLVHRWFGRIVVIEAVVHTVCYMTKVVMYTGGWKSIQKSLMGSEMIITGFVGTVCMVVILIQASTVIRHAFYETFLHLHILLVITIIVALWYHLNELDQLIYLKIVIAAWAAERGVRLLSLLYRNTGNGGTKAVIEALPGDAIRVTLKLSRPWAFRPGQHMFLTMPTVGLWTSHPFSVAWSSTEDHLMPISSSSSSDHEKGLVSPLPLTRQDVLAHQKATFSSIIRRRDGFTHALFKRASKAPNGRIVIPAFAEGPYGGQHSLHSYGTVVLFAGGVGITHQVPYVRDLVAGFANSTVAARRVLLVWVIQSPEHLEWIRPWMTSILALDRRRDILRIQLFVTRPRSTKEIHSPSATVQMFPGRPNVDTLIGIECENMVGAMGVSVCGTGGLADSVRDAVRRRQGQANVDFVEESFSW